MERGKRLFLIFCPTFIRPDSGRIRIKRSGDIRPTATPSDCQIGDGADISGSQGTIADVSIGKHAARSQRSGGGEDLASMDCNRASTQITAARELKDKAMSILTSVGLSAKANDYAGGLSGGQRKLLEIGRALDGRSTANFIRRTSGRRQSSA